MSGLVYVGDKCVTSAAYQYAKQVTAEETKEAKAGDMLNSLRERYSNLNIGTNTKPFSGTGINNLAIAPGILKQMASDPKKREEYEALIYDINHMIESTPERMPGTGAKIKAQGVFINEDGTCGMWTITESSDGKEEKKVDKTDREHRKEWLEKQRQKRKEEQKKLQERADARMDGFTFYSATTNAEVRIEVNASSSFNWEA